MLRLIRLWLLWRIARIAVPLLVMLVLLGELSTSIHRQPLVSVPRSLAPIAAVIRHASAGLIGGARRDLTKELERGASRR
jgi:hypothetical protein